MEFRLGELFCGPGGLALGAKRSVVEHGGTKYVISHQWANDKDPDSCETYRENICPNLPASVICEDVKKLEFDRLQDIDGLAFGFPCNYFSLVGETRGMNGVYGPLY